MKNFSLQFKAPCRKRHRRISENISEYTTLFLRKWHLLSQIFLNILWYTAKRLGELPLFFRYPRHKWHWRISENISEYIRLLLSKQYLFLQIFSYILRYTAKQVERKLQAHLSPAILPHSHYDETIRWKLPRNLTLITL